MLEPAAILAHERAPVRARYSDRLGLAQLHQYPSGFNPRIGQDVLGMISTSDRFGALSQRFSLPLLARPWGTR